MCTYISNNAIIPLWDHDEYVTSLTRNSRLQYDEYYGYGQSMLMFTIDRQILNHHIAIYPYNWFNTYQNTNKKYINPPAELSKVNQLLYESCRYKYESEERIYKPISFNNKAIIGLSVNISNILSNHTDQQQLLYVLNYINNTHHSFTVYDG